MKHDVFNNFEYVLEASNGKHGKLSWNFPLQNLREEGVQALSAAICGIVWVNER